MESLKELNKIVQKPDYKKKGNWMARHLVRDAALPVTWLFLHTNVTANQVTLMSLGIGFLGIAWLTVPAMSGFFIGVVLLQLWYLLDHVDGQIARYRKQVTLTGRFFDFLTHHLIHAALFFGFGLYAYHETGIAFFIKWGFLPALAITLFNLLHDVKYKTFYEKMSTHEKTSFYFKAAHVDNHLNQVKKGRFRDVFSWLHKSCEIHVVMNVLTIGAVLEGLVFKDFDVRILCFIYYSAAAPLMAVTKTVYWISSRKIDNDYERSIGEEPRGS